jgi:hypothetical protein
MKNVSEKNEKNEKKYDCINCDYKTYKKTDYTRHLSTVKHINMHNDVKCLQKNEKSFECECGKFYSSRQTLYVHKKKCNKKLEDVCESKSEKSNEALILKLLAQNALLQNSLLEMIPKLGTTNINNGIITTNVNVQLYLNENCKDAMSISDFVSGMSVEVSDLLVTKEKGAIEGISALLINHLNKLPMCQRPLWCSDKKRKRLFVKEAVWEEDTNNVKTKEAIYNISKVQTRNLTKYIADKPDWINNDNHKDEYMLIIRSATETMQDRTEKVIDKILNEISFTDNKKYI